MRLINSESRVHVGLDEHVVLKGCHVTVGKSVGGANGLIHCSFSLQVTVA